MQADPLQVCSVPAEIVNADACVRFVHVTCGFYPVESVAGLVQRLATLLLASAT